MTYENCVTRTHITAWNERALPTGLIPVRFVAVLRGSLLPISIWLGVAAFTFFVYNPVVTLIEGGLFLACFLFSFNRRRKSHSMKCSTYGAVGGVFKESMAGF
ncbi:hypothetical protein OG594_04800 [Streptomyces sp. NBC_01214]|uniref:hypothetical protein n=1 Tax=Streptomyces sp. NBC_01214 TaxID=2903777 RepID=UPI00224E93A5|nr:hypothetical protein [Streptomyces sp. NBC_01214]MCX4800981.1 hypothetical protein [Streptomyces sp. NBC_01214]